MADIPIRKAQVRDVKTIHGLLLECSHTGLLLPRPFSDLYSHLRDFTVAVENERTIGCCALAICWDDVAEVRSLAVVEEHHRQGVGLKLVEACLSEAVALGIYRVFTLTYQTRFFSRLGFKEVSKDLLPQKVWADCVNCPKFPDCDEIAMLIEL
ncbi:MAG: N-acetyltransferase [Desulfovibrio sp.]|nr:MAG: N-acetyltransferase [Desulfovibrio sp.]